jgi:outer membrane receptor for ferric coprogen and ferric-rhodotorulic acid
MLRAVPSRVSNQTPVARLVRQATALCASAALLSPLAVMAADAAPAAPDELTMDAIPTVNISGKHDATTEKSKSFTTRSSTLFKGEQDIRDTPQPVTIITRQLLNERNMLDLTDVLNNTPGIQVDYTDSERLSYNSRGFGIDALQLDGLTYSQAGSAFVQPDTAVLDRVEVLRGASGMLRGSGNPSATVNLVRKRPTREFQANGAIIVGSWERRRVEADVSSPLNESGSIRGRVVAVKDKKEFFQKAKEEEREVLYGVVQADLSPNTTLSASLQHTDMDATGAWGGLPGNLDGSPLNLPNDTYLGVAWNKWNRYNDQAQVELEHRFDNGWTVRANAGYTALRLKDNAFKQSYVTRAANATNPYEMTITTAQYTGNDSRQRAMNLVADGPFTLFGRKHALVIGAEHVRNHSADSFGAGSLFPQVIDIRTFDPYTSYPERDVPMPNTGNKPVITTTDGAYATARFSVSERLSALVGARLSWWEADSKVNASNSYKVTREVTPYLGLVYDINDQLSAYASYTEIFTPQNVRGANGDTLDPIVGEDYELGLKGEFFGGRLNASLGVFQIGNVGRAIEDTSSINPCLPYFTSGYCRVAGGKQLSEGYEAEIAGEIMEGWQLTAGYTNTRTKYVTDTAANTGQPLRSIDPKHQLRLFTSYSANRSGPGWTVGGGVQMQSDSYVRSSGLTATQGGYGVANAMFAYRFTDKLEIQANVNNLFDKVYYKKFAPTGISYYYGDPRNVSLTLRGSL